MQEVAKDLTEEAKSLAGNATLALVVGGLVAVLLGLSIGYWVAHKLALGIGQVANVAQLAASGNYQARAKIASKDELGQKAASFNAMLDRITALVTSESERDDMQKRLMGFLVLVSDVGKGDLTKRGEVTADMFGNLADGFNLMIVRFGQLLKQVRESAERVNKSAGSLRDSAGQMAGTAKHQADESSKTLSAVEQLASSMRQVSETAGASSESAKQVLLATERGRVAVQETVQDMQSIRSAVQRMSKQVKALGDRSLEISQIVSTIRDIANQTNLLALNAAFRSGWAGLDGNRAVIVEDILTTGGSVQEVVECLKEKGVTVAGVYVLVDRTAGSVPIGGQPGGSLLPLKVEAFEPEACPLCRAGVPLFKPGASDKK